ncbi:palmitoyltransferase swf1 [Lignoscripta atroalba]|nr:palmitoyltransferase swf1 [Lignoscripta atroalba]
MLLSLSTLLSYGAYISYMLLDRFLQESLLRRAQGMYGRSHWSVGRSWNEYFQLWAWSFSQEIRLGGVGMLALLTAPLAFGLFIYHIYLIWAGMTTNESFKWAEWKDDVFDGFVYKEDDAVAQRDSIMSDPELEPRVAWPLARRQVLINRANRQSPHYNYYMQSSTEWDNTRSLSWKRVNSMSEVENIYDLGFWTNIRDVLGLQLSNFPVLVAGSDQQ